MSFCFKLACSFLKLILKNVCFFTGKFTTLTSIVISDIWPYLQYSVYVFCLGVMSRCLFWVCLCLALWLVFWLLLSSVVIWNIDIPFFKKFYLWLLLSFQITCDPIFWKNIKFMNETKTFDSHYGILESSMFILSLQLPPFTFWPLLI